MPRNCLIWRMLARRFSQCQWCPLPRDVGRVLRILGIDSLDLAKSWSILPMLGTVFPVFLGGSRYVQAYDARSDDIRHRCRRYSPKFLLSRTVSDPHWRHDTTLTSRQHQQPKQLPFTMQGAMQEAASNLDPAYCPTIRVRPHRLGLLASGWHAGHRQTC